MNYELFIINVHWVYAIKHTLNTFMLAYDFEDTTLSKYVSSSPNRNTLLSFLIYIFTQSPDVSTTRDNGTNKNILAVD